MPKRAVLLVNLGSPDSTAVPDVRTYLQEFLGDERVIDKPAWAPARRFLVNQIICRTRAPKSAKAYEEIWTDRGSPLVLTSQAVAAKLSAELGPDTPVYLAMRYRQPSIESVLARMAADGIEQSLNHGIDPADDRSERPHTGVHHDQIPRLHAKIGQVATEGSSCCRGHWELLAFSQAHLV